MNRLIRNLHTKSWCSYGEAEAAIPVRVGGRQGCKYGSTIFNGSYSVALFILRDALLDADIVLRIPSGGNDFWAQSNNNVGEERPETAVVDATFVDDECVMLAAATPKILDSSIDALLKATTEIFDMMRLTINWKPGKTECFLVYRGQRAGIHYSSRRVGPNNKLVVRVPGKTDAITVVNRYKHLGGIQRPDGKNIDEAHHRSNTAMTAYAPLATRVFGSTVVCNTTKFSLLRSLVHSRLLFNAHVRTPDMRWLRVLNATYMRGLRRISGDCRFEHTIPDVEVRRKLQMPSFDCVLVRKRFAYLARVVRCGPTVLTALLAARPRGHIMPWTSVIIKDLQCLWAMAAKCAHLSDPAGSSREWLVWIEARPEEFRQAIACVYFVESSCDRGAEIVVGLEQARVRAHKCDVCGMTFCSTKALASHSRAKHDVRVAQRLFCDEHGECQVCGTQFRTRLRLLAHLCDSRRSRCWDAICTNTFKFKEMSHKRCAELDDCDRAARTSAYKEGRTHPLAVGAARTREGKLVGFARL